MSEHTVLCPRCQTNSFVPYGVVMSEPGDRPALSRTDNKTYICSACGTDEALLDWAGASLLPPSEWPIKKESS